MKMKTAELTERQLDYLVAKVRGREYMAQQVIDRPMSYTYKASTDWCVGGPIIREGKIVLSPNTDGGWIARSFTDATEHYGPTPLIAIMRCYIDDHLGDEVDIPEELLK